MKSPIAVYISFGSNLGDRRSNIQRALNLLGELPETEKTQVSSIIETKPVGGPKQNNFLNGVAELKTSLRPHVLLQRLNKIEAALGRLRDVRWGPRVIDLDILLYGKKVIDTDNLQIPHPRMHERAFVLDPLNEIAPRAWHPQLKKYIHELADDRSSPATSAPR